MSNPQENRIAKLYEIANSDNTFILPKSVTKEQLLEYIEVMIKDAQPRLKRTDGRQSLRVEDYNIPENYFLVESNSVNFHSSMGTTVTFDEPDETTVELDIGEKGIDITVPNRFRENDIGQQLCLYIFKNGRKTLEELITELSSLDKHMLILLVNKLVVDGYLKRYEEEDGLETLELIETKDLKAIEDKDNE